MFNVDDTREQNGRGDAEKVPPAGTRALTRPVPACQPPSTTLRRSFCVLCECVCLCWAVHCVMHVLLHKAGTFSCSPRIQSLPHRKPVHPRGCTACPVFGAATTDKGTRRRNAWIYPARELEARDPRTGLASALKSNSISKAGGSIRSMHAPQSQSHPGTSSNETHSGGTTPLAHDKRSRSSDDVERFGVARKRRQDVPTPLIGPVDGSTSRRSDPACTLFLEAHP